MTAFRFVTLVCDQCYDAFDPGTALTEADAREDAADRGWTQPATGEDQCRRCGNSAEKTEPLIEELGIGTPVQIPAR